MQPNITLIDDFLTEPDAIFTHVKETTDWDERMRARKTASFGVTYDYSGITYEPNVMPDYLQSICLEIQKELGFLPNNCLMNYYMDGNSSMGFHSDSAEALVPDTGVVIISLGSEREITYRKTAQRDIKKAFLLKSGSLLYMTEAMQQEWQHAILKKDSCGERISLTFRAVVK